MQTNQQNGAIKRLGIVLLPTTDVIQTAEQLTRQILKLYGVNYIDYLSKGANTPHISLYHADFDIRQLTTLKQLLQEYTTSCPFLSFKNELDLFEYEYVFWSIKPNNELQNLHESIIKQFSQYSLFTEPTPSEMKNLTPTQQQYLINYGSHLIFENYLLHITVLYPYPKTVIQLATKIASLEVPAITTEPIAITIAELGSNGQVQNILAKLPVCSK